MDYVQKKVPVDPVIVNWTKYFAPLDCYTTNNNLYTLLKRDANMRLEMTEAMFYNAFLIASMQSMELPHEFELFRHANILVNATSIFVASRDIEPWKRAIPDYMHFFRIVGIVNIDSKFSVELQKHIKDLNENISSS